MSNMKLIQKIKKKHKKLIGSAFLKKKIPSSVTENINLDHRFFFTYLRIKIFKYVFLKIL